VKTTSKVQAKPAPDKCSRNAGKFRKGESGNPAGKKPGTKNRASIFREALDTEKQAIVR